MKDFSPKGTGNSRFLKSAIAPTTTWEQFRDLLIGGTAPIDLNGVNPLGVDEIGTALSKANLLTDATATALGLVPANNPTVNDALNSVYSKTQSVSTATKSLYGLGVAAVPDDVLVAVKALIDGKPKIATGFYTGTNTYGVSHPTTIVFPFLPKVLIITTALSASCAPVTDSSSSMVINYAGLNSAFYPPSSLSILEHTQTFSIYTTGNYASTQFNESGTTYHWTIIA